jgi:lysophospholipid acyltransferase (LPLAT)-like uncharacterized protein
MAETLPAKKKQKDAGFIRRSLKALGESRALWRAGGLASATYMRFVRTTSRLSFEPGNPFRVYRDRAPFILTAWHGHQSMVVYLLEAGDRLCALTSKSRDGELSASYLESFGVELIRGSGGRDPRKAVKKGAIRGFLQMKKALDDGVSIGTIADVVGLPKVSGNGVVSLAKASGRPIIPLGFATSRWVELKTWDRAIVHLPFSRAVCVASEPIDVPRDADEALIEEKRLAVENALNAATARAYEIVTARR